MVNNVVNGTYTETYDLKTTTGKMAILGIHTPTAASLKKMFHGYFEQYRKIKVNGCNIIGVCASNQSLTPAEVGLEAGKTDPRDILNPILFKACTGDNLNLLLDKIYGTSGNDTGSIHRIDTGSEAGGLTLDAYYTMLADDSFRKFHPQGGVRVAGLRPMVHRVATTQPFKWSNSSAYDGVGGKDHPSITGAGDNTAGVARGFGASDGSSGGVPSVFISNGIEPMPWMDTTYEGVATDITELDDPQTVTATVLAANIPKIYCGVLILPPSILQSLYFRFSISWSISFRGFRPAYEIGDIGSSQIAENVGMNSTSLYFNLYNTESKLTDQFGSFDCDNVDTAETVMEKVY